MGTHVFDRKLSTGRISERAGKRLKEVRNILKDEIEEPYLIDFFKTLPSRYFSANRAEEIAGHVRMLNRLKERPILMDISYNREVGFHTVTICTLDMPGLFSKITGVMAANSLNILDAQLYTRKDGTVLDILTINDPFGRFAEDEKRWSILKDEMVSVIEGRVSVDAILAKKTAPPAIKGKVRPKHPAVVEIDNLISDTHTVVDIFADDRIGLLYSIASTLIRLGLYIDVAKISTRGDQAADVFYVKDIFAHKITDEGKLNKIRTAILDVA